MRTPRNILVTAGTVYGRLDANKLVGNRIRGIWATKFAAFLHAHDFYVTLLIPDTYPALPSYPEFPGLVKVVRHSGFWDYEKKVLELVPMMDGAVLAAAVVNWIPEKPFEGKMPTKGVGNRMNIPFILAPRVIDQVKQLKPDLTLIGCKMTIGATDQELRDAANELISSARCAAVVMNDMETGLHQKTVLYPDQATFAFNMHENGGRFYTHLMEVLRDRHYRTEVTPTAVGEVPPEAYALFDRIVEKYRNRFVPAGKNRVFGSLAVRLSFGGAALMSPREKGEHFTSKDAVVVAHVEGQTVYTIGGKATLNAPLLAKHLLKHPAARAVLHLHEQLPDPSISVQEYAPPGTIRDSIREGPHSIFNIRGHGFIAALDDEGEMLLC